MADTVLISGVAVLGLLAAAIVFVGVINGLVNVIAWLMGWDE